MNQLPIGFQRDRRTLALVVNRFACMLETRVDRYPDCDGENIRPDFFTMPDGTHFDRFVAMLAEIGERASDPGFASLMGDDDEELLEEALAALRRVYDEAPLG